jgi:hypothetical protein
VTIEAYQASGGSVANLVADGNVLNVSCYRGGATTTLLILDEDGDLHLDAGSATGTANTVDTTAKHVDGYYTFDSEDDVALVRTMVREMYPGHVVDDVFDEFLRYNREDLERLGLCSFDEQGHAFYNLSGMVRLQAGAIWQEYAKRMQLERRVAKLEAALSKLLPAPDRPALPA